jgi:hypothetical protein
MHFSTSNGLIRVSKNARSLAGVEPKDRENMQMKPAMGGPQGEEIAN